MTTNQQKTDETSKAPDEDDLEHAPFAFDTDFNVEDEFKTPPLIPNGKYEGNVTEVKFDPASSSLVWQVVLIADSDTLMSDNETPVNGSLVFYRNWLPKSGDENIRTKNGKSTKRQAKINMLQEFQKKMRINMNTPDAIVDGVGNGEWIGLNVVVLVEVREWEGRLSNQVKDMSAS